MSTKVVLRVNLDLLMPKEGLKFVPIIRKDHFIEVILSFLRQFLFPVTKDRVHELRWVVDIVLIFLSDFVHKLFFLFCQRVLLNSQICGLMHHFLEVQTCDGPDLGFDIFVTRFSV